MKKKIKIILYPEEHKSKNGVFFEDLMRNILDKEGYILNQNINFTGLEIDLLAKHKTRNETLIVECKAKEKVKSTELKNFAFNVMDKEVDYGYFVHTEELDHQAAGLRDEWKNKAKYKNLTFLGPDKIIELLIDANKIKTLDISKIPSQEAIDEIVLAYAFFGIFYIIIPYDGTKKTFFYLVDAVTGLIYSNVKELANSDISDNLTKENILKKEVKEIANLSFVDLNQTKKHDTTPEIQKFTCDYPVELSNWVGRKQELKNIELKNFNVVFITGIGGQGKSALASYYIQNIVSFDNYWEYWDWRDLKEEGNRLHTKVISIIERLTLGKVNPVNIKDEPLEILLEMVFKYLKDRKIVFVFDNVDKYIDLEEFTLTGGLKTLYDFIKRSPHSSKFIFTCRPSVMIADVDFYQIKLDGISEDETIELFKKSDINFKEEELERIAKETYKITNGHPHWIKLFIGQSYSGKEELFKFIKIVKDKTNFKEDNLSAIYSVNILNAIWDTLNDNQKVLLRSLAETVKAEIEKDLGKIVNPELNYNRFHRAMKKLKRLNLIVTKVLKDEKDQLELHPLVKEFVLQKYPLQNERSKFITLFVNYYDNVICVLRERLNWNMSFKDFEQWTSKIELEVNNHDFKSALITLKEVEDPLLTAGYLTEFIRVSNLIFSNIDWRNAVSEEYSYFNELLKVYITTLTELGRTVKANDLIAKYSNTIHGKGGNYINYCEINCYYHWFSGDYENAIKWGERIVELKKSENGNHIINSLALAWRDSKEDKNIDKAIKFFLEGEDIKEVIKPQIIKNELNGPFYGNIGRCLFFKKDYDNAITCYRKSYQMLDKEKVTDTDMNKGFAFLWICEALFEKKDYKSALFFAKNASHLWENISPPKAKIANNLIENIKKLYVSHNNINTLGEDEINDFCRKWINN
ncbi:MAG: NB-ARC domain-containing protein [Bacteroidota bacterium]